MTNQATSGDSPRPIDKTKLKVEETEVYVWAAVDVETFEVIHIQVFPGRSSLDALLFLKEVLKYCHSQPIALADRGDWYDWPLDLLDCEPKRELWRDRSFIEAWFGVLKFRTMLFRHLFPTTVVENQPEVGSLPLPLSTMPCSKVKTPGSRIIAACEKRSLMTASNSSSETV